MMICKNMHVHVELNSLFWLNRPPVYTVTTLIIGFTSTSSTMDCIILRIAILWDLEVQYMQVILIYLQFIFTRIQKRTKKSLEGETRSIVRREDFFNGVSVGCGTEIQS